MNKIKNLRGFTILEVLIASMILVMAGVGAVLVEKQAIQSSTFNKHKLQATGLAQEALNLSEQIFTSNLINNNQDSSYSLLTNLGGDKPGENPYCVYFAADGWKLTNTPVAGSSCSTIPEKINLNGVEFTRKINIGN